MRKIGFLLVLVLSCRPVAVNPDYANEWMGIYQALIMEPGIARKLEIELRADMTFRMAELDYRDNKVKKQKGRAYMEQGNLILPLKADTLRIQKESLNTISNKLPIFQLQRLDSDRNYLSQTWICVQLDTLYFLDNIDLELSLGIMGDTLFGGYSGCNDFGGFLEVESHEKLRFKQLNQTLLLCEGSADLEAYYLDLLRKSRYYHFPNASHLELRDSLREHPIYFRRNSILE